MQEKQELTVSNDKIWDFTTIDTFQRCRRYYYWRMVRHLEKTTISPALEFGRAMHEALDIHYTLGTNEALEKFRATYKDIEGDEIRTVENGVKVLEWYAKVYPSEPFKIVGKPEAGFVFQLGDIMWGGRLDLPVEWDGQLWVMEHKTTTRLDSNFFKQFALDKQITGYTVGVEECFGRKCSGCIVNAIEVWKELKRPTVKSKRPEDHFVRDPIMRSSMLKERFKVNVNKIVRDILWCEKENEFYEAEKKDVCFSYNYDCPYRTLCEFGEDPRVISRDYRETVWAPYAPKVEEPNVKVE